MSRGYDRDYDADYSDVHQVPVEPMGFWGLSDRSRRWARQEDRWGSSDRSSRRPGQERWAGASGPPPRDRGYGQRDYGRDYNAGRVPYRPGDPRPGTPWQHHPGRHGWGVAGPRRYGRDFQEDSGMSRSWPERAPEQGRERERPHRYDREYGGRGRRRMGARGEEIPWDIDRPSLEGPVPGYPERTPTDAWGVYRPAWFGGEAHRRDRQQQGAWSYGAQRRSMYEATGSRPRERQGRDVPRRERPGRWSWSD